MSCIYPAHGYRRYGAIVIALLLFPLHTFAAGGFESSGTHLDKANCSTPGAPCVLTLEESGASTLREQWTKTDDPSEDGWDTEVFNNQAGNQLKTLGKLILHPQDATATALHALITDGFSSGPLTTDALTVVFKDQNFTVARAHNLSANDALFKGNSGLTQQLKAVSEPFAKSSDVRFKFKLFSVNKSAGTIVSKQYFSISGETPHGALEQNATWEIVWQPSEGDAPPKLQHVKVIALEQISLQRNNGKLFKDVTAAVMGKNPSYNQQILRGLPAHLRTMENVQSFAIFGTPGLAVGDVNNDGRDDLYLCQEEGLPNRLYLQNDDGTLEDISAVSNTDWLQSSRSALLIDFDNDGDQDLAVAVRAAVVFAENNGSAGFTVRSVTPVNDDTMSMAAADYDLDGDIDVYITAYNPNQRLEPQGASESDDVFVYHDANNGPANSLLRNDIASVQRWLFTDVTAATGLDVNNSRFSLATAWEDYDNDGDVDLYVANDYGRDNLYRNELIPTGKPWFSDVSAVAEIEDSAGGMSVTWGDYNRDGWIDLYLSGMWSSAGNRITFQDSFKPENQEVKKRLQKFARGNALYLNQGDGTFRDISESAGVAMGRWAWGSQFFDLNSDGWEDLIVANGFLTGDTKGGDL